MSTLKVDTWKDAAGTNEFYKCRAWVNFNGTGTVAINASGNVASITDNGVGDYTVNFTNAMPDANYAVTGAARVAASSGLGSVTIGLFGFYNGSLNDSAPTTTSFRMKTLTQGTNNQFDASAVCLAVFR